ncbi:MAG: glycosyl transferase family 36 [Phycisphaeraceae bacterium]|nr:MAG: glycosyl transferase family 36 [Phycisphaeraceae bacterium]
MLANRYGAFDPSGRSYTITDAGTPMPWVNVISNGRYGVVVSQNGGGFSFYDDAQHNVLTRWEMDLARDVHGRFVYLAEVGADGRVMGPVWSASPSPCRASYDEYRCTHGLGWTRFETVRDGIACVWTIAVSPGDAAEVWEVRLENRSSRARRVRVSSYLEWCCGVAPDSKREFHRLFLEVSHDAGRRAVLARKHMWDIPGTSEREHWNVGWPYVAAHAASGPFVRELAVGDKRLFLGRYGAPHSPAAMTSEGCAVGGFGRYGDGVAAVGGEVEIAAGGSATVGYVTAIAGDEAGVLALVDKHRAAGAGERARAASESGWLERLSAVSVESERPDFDVMNNYWLGYQAVSGRLWGRTGYYQQSGAFGFRDQLQDSQEWLVQDPPRCAEQIMRHAGRMFADGSVNHWWHALADFGNRTACSDDYLWLAFVTASYVRETGDYAVLDRWAPYRDCVKGGSLKDHCERALARAFSRTSERGLCLIGSCDWNDGLSAAGIEGRGESVWLTIWLCAVLEEWASVLERSGDAGLASAHRARARAYASAANEHGWDGSWYRAATTDAGVWLGSRESREGRIHLNPQTWAILSGVAGPERRGEAWASVKRELLTAYGPLLLAPAYSEPDASVGYITRYSPGSRENGGVYMHAATWALAAACEMGDAEAVGSIWRGISPPLRGQDAERYSAEPYVTPGNVDGPTSEHPGRAGWTWYTGSAAWLKRVCVERVLGVRPVWVEGGEGLLIDPRPMAELGKVSVSRRWRGVEVRVRFDAGAYVPGRAAVVRVDGVETESGVVAPAVAGRAASSGRRVEVEVCWPAAVGGGGPVVRGAGVEVKAPTGGRSL